MNKLIFTLILLFVVASSVSVSPVSADNGRVPSVYLVEQGAINNLTCMLEESVPCGSVAHVLGIAAHPDPITIKVRPGFYQDAIYLNHLDVDVEIIAVDASDQPCAAGSTCATLSNPGSSYLLWMDGSSSLSLSGFELNLIKSSTPFTFNAAAGSTASVSLDNFTITGGPESSRVMDVHENVTITLSNCEMNNISTSFAPLRNGGTMTVDTCSFTGNESENGTGGVLDNVYRLDVRNSLFESNSASGAGGAIHASCVEIGSSTPCANLGQAKLDIRDSNFASNDAGGKGGAIFADNMGQVQIIDVGVTQNSAEVRGGGIAIDYASSYVLLNDVDATGNSVVFDPEALTYGGGIAIESAYELLNSTVSGNSAMIGGGIYLVGLANNTIDENLVLNTTVTNNVSLDGAGAGIAVQNNFESAATAIPTTFDTVTFSGNSDVGFADAGDITLRGGTGLYLKTDSDITIQDSNFLNNNSGLSRGGGLRMIGGGSNSMVNSSFVNNEAYSCGALDNATTLTTVGTSFVNNSSASSNVVHGGAICNEGSLTMFNGAIRDNTAPTGGGIYNVGAVILFGMTIDGNSAELALDDTFASNAGGIFNAGTLTAANSTVSGNTASNNGGGIYNSGTATVNFTTITNNSADSDNNSFGDGGGIFLNDGSFTMSNSILAANLDASTGTFSFYMPDCGAGLGSGKKLTSAGYNVIGFSNCAFDGDTTGDDVGTSVSPLDPQLGALGSNGGSTQTHLPAATSPAVNNVSDTSRCTGLLLSLDQRNYSRPSGSGCDSGSVEFGGVLVPTAVDLQLVGTERAAFGSLLVLFGALTLVTLYAVEDGSSLACLSRRNTTQH